MSDLRGIREKNLVYAGIGSRTTPPEVLADMTKMAARLHPAWSRCSPGARSLHARNVSIVLGASLQRPVDALIAWTAGGLLQGGTGLGLRIAMDYDIPVLNLAVMTPRAACERLLAIRRAA